MYFFCHHSHAFFIHSIKDDFYFSELSEHTKQGNNLIFLKIVKQSACGNKDRGIGKIRANLPDPVLGKGISGKVGLPFRFWEQFPPVVNDVWQINGIPAASFRYHSGNKLFQVRSRAGRSLRPVCALKTPE